MKSGSISALCAAMLVSLFAFSAFAAVSFEGGFYQIQDTPQGGEDPHGDEKSIEWDYNDPDKDYCSGVMINGVYEPAVLRDNRRYGFAIPVVGEGDVTPEIVHLTSNASYFYEPNVINDAEIQEWEWWNCSKPSPNSNRRWIIILCKEIPYTRPDSNETYTFDIKSMKAANGEKLLDWAKEHGETFPASISLPESVSFKVRIKETGEEFGKRFWNVYNPMYDKLPMFDGEHYEDEDYIEGPMLWLVTSEMLHASFYLNDDGTPKMYCGEIDDDAINREYGHGLVAIGAYTRPTNEYVVDVDSDLYIPVKLASANENIKPELLTKYPTTIGTDITMEVLTDAQVRQLFYKDGGSPSWPTSSLNGIEVHYVYKEETDYSWTEYVCPNWLWPDGAVATSLRKWIHVKTLDKLDRRNFLPSYQIKLGSTITPLVTITEDGREGMLLAGAATGLPVHWYSDANRGKGNFNFVQNTNLGNPAGYQREGEVYPNVAKNGDAAKWMFESYSMDDEYGHYLGVTVPSAGTLVIRKLVPSLSGNESWPYYANSPYHGTGHGKDEWVYEFSNSFDNVGFIGDISDCKLEKSTQTVYLTIKNAGTVWINAWDEYNQMMSDEFGVDAIHFYPSNNKALAVNVDPVQYVKLPLAGEEFPVVPGHISGTGSYAAGQTFKITAEGKCGNEFDHWETDSELIQIADPQAATTTVTVKSLDAAGTYPQTTIHAVWKMPTFEPGEVPLEVKGWEGFRDGKAHSITVKCLDTNIRATIEYSVDGGKTWSTVNPTFSNVGTYEVAYRVKATGYEASGSETVNIKSELDITWEDYNDGVMITKITGAPIGGVLSIPSEIEGKKVVAIGTDALNPDDDEDRTGMTTLTIPKTVTDIDYAALGCNTSLTKIIVEEGNPKYRTVENGRLLLEDWGDYQGVIQAASYPNGTITIPEGVVSICYEAFANMNIGKIVFPSTLETVDNEAFNSIEGVTELDFFGTRLNSIGYKAFEDHTSIQTIKFPATLEHIGPGAFSECPALEAVCFSGKLPSVQQDVRGELFDGSSKVTVFVGDDESWEEVLAEGSWEGAKVSALYSVSDASFTYDGAAHTIAAVVAPNSGAVLTYSTSETGNYSSNKPTRTDAGETVVWVKVALNGAHALTTSAKVTIAPKTLTSEMVKDFADLEYTGAALTPAPQFNDPLVKASDYEVSYSDNVDYGTATVTITGKNNFAGTVTKTFKVAKTLIRYTASGYTGVYDGKAHGITINVTKPTTGATITYSPAENSFTDVGEYKVSYGITAENFEAVENKSEIVKITPKALTSAMVTPATITGTFVENGSPFTPAVTVADGELLKASDYDIAYENNVSRGTATIRVTAKGNYAGVVTRTFFIKGKMKQEAMSEKPLDEKWNGRWDGKAHGTAIAVDGVEGARVYYRTDLSAAWSASVPTFTEVGEYTIYYKVEANGWETYENSYTVTVLTQYDWFADGGDGIITRVVPAPKDDLVVPEEFDGVKFSGLATELFRGNKELVSITLPETITTIGDRVFENCENLKSVTFLGNCPANCGSDLYNNVKGVVTYVTPDSTASWGGEDGDLERLPQSWMGRPIVYTGGVVPKDFDVVVSSFFGYEDGIGHTISVTAKYPPADMKLYFLVGGEWVAKAPVFKAEGTYEVSFKIMAEGYYSAKGMGTVVIQKKIDSDRITKNPEMPVEYGWLEANAAVLGLPKNPTAEDYEKAALKSTGKAKLRGGTFTAFEEYVMGTDPSNPDSIFQVNVEEVNGRKTLVPSPDMRTQHRVYKYYHKAQLTDNDWEEITEEEADELLNPDPRARMARSSGFFTADVDLDDEIKAAAHKIQNGVTGGDMDSDGKLSMNDLYRIKDIIFDVVYTKKLTVDQLSPADRAAADVDNDGKITEADVIAILQLIQAQN